MAAKYLKFIVSRLIGTLVDTFVLWVFSTYVFSSYIGNYMIAPTISFEVAVFTNFIFSYYWIWSKRITIKNTKTFISHLFFFNISCVLGFIVKMVFLLLFERLFGWDVIYCNLMALLISGIVNYTLAEFIVFKKRPPIIEAINDVESL
ncbi:MAG: GtrA family protein [Bacteroidetes bacterium HGW-Bacteroidetes-7]|jgi:putative flippase GtrA|nr:MAG: GtrA family protein [Bacteroidetes bacterium HGW-Bacteroidetes-7]